MAAAVPLTATAQSVAATTAVAGNQQQPLKSEKYTLLDLIFKVFEDRIVYITKTLSYALFWVGRTVSLPSQATAFSDTMGDFKNIVSAAETPKKALEAWDSLKETVQVAGKKGVCAAGSAARKAMEKVSTLTNSVVDGIDFNQRFVPINAALMTTLKGISSVATLAGCGSEALREIKNIQGLKSEQKTQRNHHMLKLALFVSYAAIGVLGILAWTGAAVIAPWMFLACLTSGLTWSIGSFFYERLYDPEGKGKDLNPDIVIKNKITVESRAAAAPAA